MSEDNVSDQNGYQPVTQKVVEVRTPTSSTRFHAPNDRVDFEREKHDEARQERQAQALHAILPNPRGRW